MALRDAPPFRADHVGSLLRPEPLKRARADHSAGRIGDEELKAAEDDAIVEVIGQQEDVGLRTVTDGEFRRSSWHMDFIYQLGGLETIEGEQVHVAFKSADKELDYAPAAIHVADRLSLPEPIFVDDFAFVRDHAGTGTPKLTIPSPSMVHYRLSSADAIDSAAYGDLDEFWADLAAAYNAQMRAVYDAGCRYLQLDDTSLAYINDPAQREHIEAIGGDPDHLHEQYIANINAALAGRPDDLVVTTHMCRGNNQSMWVAEGGYDKVAEALFGDLEIDGYFMEYDDERSGTFEPLRYVPPGKTVVLGLVTTKRPELESKDQLKGRIEEASRFVDVDQLCLSGQCGFSSTEEGNDLTIDEQFAKLRLIVETADEVWG